MNKTQSEELTINVLLADILLRLKTIEELLLAKNICTSEEFLSIMNDISTKIAKSLLEKAEVKGDLDEIIQSIKKK